MYGPNTLDPRLWYIAQVLVRNIRDPLNQAWAKEYLGLLAPSQTQEI